MFSCSETTSKVAVSRKALRPPKKLFLLKGTAYGMRGYPETYSVFAKNFFDSTKQPVDKVVELSYDCRQVNDYSFIGGG
jgi:hypothetical protein